MTGVDDVSGVDDPAHPFTAMGDAWGTSVLRVDLPYSDTSPREARDHLLRWLGGRAGPDPTESVAVVASELVTNAVIHTRSAPLLTASLADDRVHLEVHDADASPPVRVVAGGSNGGFGLRIVVHLSAGWGWFHTSTGKIVWADIAV